MQAIQLAPEAQVSAKFQDLTSTVPPAPASLHTLETELAEALKGCTRGDAFVFGSCSEDYERALRHGLSRDARTFRCTDRAARQRRYWIDMEELDERSLAALRAKHHVHRVSVVVVAGDFSWSLDRVVRSLRSVLANQAVLIVTGRQAALVESLELEELRGGQADFDVARLGESAASMARFILRRRHSI